MNDPGENSVVRSGDLNLVTSLPAVTAATSINGHHISENRHQMMTSSPSASVASSASPASSQIQSFSGAGTTDQLERCGKWLSSIPRDDVTALRDTPEYQDFLLAFERLGHAHRRVITTNSNHSHSDNSPRSSPVSADSSLLSQRCSMVKGTDRRPSSQSFHESGAKSQRNFQPQQGRLQNAISSFASTDVPYALVAAISSANQPPSTLTHHHPPLTINAFLQHTDDVILRVFEFLECQSLIRASLTCSRFHQLAHRGATQRTYHIAHTRQLHNVMQLLRAHEQIFDEEDHTNEIATVGHVRVPMLLLGRRILVTNAGDPEYNGLYYCTSANGNGFVFTKPRYPIRRASDRRQQRERVHLEAVAQHGRLNDNQLEVDDQRQAGNNDNNNGRNVHRIQRLLQRPQIQQILRQQQQQNPGQRVRLIVRRHQNPQYQHQPQHPANQHLHLADGGPPAIHHPPPQQPAADGAVGEHFVPGNDTSSSVRDDEETIQAGQPLRCIISKRFSNETILWYMSKEVEVVPTAAMENGEGQHDTDERGVREIYSFWSKLMALGAASPDICRYPSQTSILARQGDEWQSLALTQRPPTVELLD